MENALLSVSSFRSLSRRDLAPAGRDHTKEAIATLLQQYLMDPLPCDGHRARTFVGLMDSKQSFESFKEPLEEKRACPYSTHLSAAQRTRLYSLIIGPFPAVPELVGKF